MHGVSRVQGEPFTIALGGEMKKVAVDGPRYSAIYEIDGPHVLVSPRGGGWREGRLGQGGAAFHTRSPPRALQGALRREGALTGQRRDWPKPGPEAPAKPNSIGLPCHLVASRPPNSQRTKQAAGRHHQKGDEPPDGGSMPPPASSATPMAQPPAADNPKPTVECSAIVAPR